MRAKGVMVGIVTLVVGLAYVAGYWPEHRRRVALEVDAESLRERLADAKARVRVGRLLGEALNIREAVGSLNYGNAQQLSSTFFDAVRAEASITPVAAFKTALEAVLQARDRVTTALARGDQAALEPLRRSELQLREVLGYPIPGPS